VAPSPVRAVIRGRAGIDRPISPRGLGRRVARFEPEPGASGGAEILRALQAIRSSGNAGGGSRQARSIPRDLHRVALRKLDMLNAALTLSDLRVPPGNRLEALRGDLSGQHSIRVNDQWRILFRWTDAGPMRVRIVDYHS
jgi:proteic killer suppression protein